MDNQRGLVQRIERKLETSVEDAFARIFGGAIVPAEVEAALRREAADGVRSLAGNRLLAPNDYVITLSGPDYQQMGSDPGLTTDTFAKHLAGYIDEQGWQTYGDVVVRFQQSSNLRTGQVRARGAVNPDASPRPSASDPAPPQSDHAVSPEPGVAPMTDNPSYRGGQGQSQPGDGYRDERYGRHQDDARGPDPRGPYPPDPGLYPPDQGGYPGPSVGGYPDQGQGGYPPRPPAQGGYPDQGQGGYPPPYEQRPPAGYGGPPAYDQGYPQAPGGYAAPQGPPQGGGQAGYGEHGGEPGGDYGRPPARPDDYRQYEGQYESAPEQRPSYPGQGGYDQGAPSYAQPDYNQPDYNQPDYNQPDYNQPGYNQPGYAQQGYNQPDYNQPDYNQPDYNQPDYAQPDYAQPDYAQPDYGRYSEAPPAPSYGEAPGQGGYDYGQQQAPGYGDSYGQYGYSPAAVTLQLDDGSGRTYQLHEGSNVIGRGQDAQFRLPDTGVSRRHLEIRWDGRVALLSDLNSTNGTTVNNAPVQEWQLADGDVIRLGHSEIIVRVH